MAKKEPKPTGRPSTFTDDKFAEIVERISNGEPLAQVCRDEHMPALRTVYDWMEERPNLSARFARAREAGYDMIAVDTLQIADDSRNDYMEKLSRSGDEQAVKAMAFDAEHVQRSKLRIETRLKLLAKWDPKRYGEKLALGGADDLPPIRTMTDEQLDAKLAALRERIVKG